MSDARPFAELAANARVFLERFDAMTARLARGEGDGVARAQEAKSRAALALIAQTARVALVAAQGEADLCVMAETDPDPELAALAKEEAEQAATTSAQHWRALLEVLSQDDDSTRGVIIEVRAGTGGEEAALFAAELWRMYFRMAARRKWKSESMGESLTPSGGVREAVGAFSGVGAYALLRHEGGAHRVQRVPATETSGRVHTSAATLAVLPEADDARDPAIDPSELRIETFRARGPGGQSVNTTDSAVRIVHIPTGVTVSQQDEKSQHRNKAKALRVLRARLLERSRAQSAGERASIRRSQVGTGDRSERVRTWNFPQGRITDHRLGRVWRGLEDALNGGTTLDAMMDALAAREAAARLARLARGEEGGTGEAG